jgi:hypothetical protein
MRLAEIYRIKIKLTMTYSHTIFLVFYNRITSTSE